MLIFKISWHVLIIICYIYIAYTIITEYIEEYHTTRATYKRALKKIKHKFQLEVMGKLEADMLERMTNTLNSKVGNSLHGLQKGDMLKLTYSIKLWKDDAENIGNLTDDKTYTVTHSEVV